MEEIKTTARPDQTNSTNSANSASPARKQQTILDNLFNEFSKTVFEFNREEMTGFLFEFACRVAELEGYNPKTEEGNLFVKFVMQERFYRTVSALRKIHTLIPNRQVRISYVTDDIEEAIMNYMTERVYQVINYRRGFEIRTKNQAAIMASMPAMHSQRE